MAQTISKIGIKDSTGTSYDTRDIGAKGQNVEVGYDASGKIILNVDTTTPTTTKTLAKVLQDAEKNIGDLNTNKAANNHAWSDADTGVNHGLADGTHYGHIKVGDGFTVNSGKVDVAYGNAANTACQGNDARLSNARKNPNSVTFNTSGGAAAGTTYDGSAAKTVDYSTVGAAPSGHTSTAASSSVLGHVKTSTGLTNSSGTISVSYGTTAGTACQGNDGRLSDSRTPKSHATTSTTYGAGNASNYGHVKLTDTYSVTTPSAATNGAATSIAASAYALQQAYSTLNSNKFGKYDGSMFTVVETVSYSTSSSQIGIWVNRQTITWTRDSGWYLLNMVHNSTNLKGGFFFTLANYYVSYWKTDSHSPNVSLCATVYLYKNSSLTLNSFHSDADGIGNASCYIRGSFLGL